MAYKFREEIVGKRFLSVSGFTKLKVNKISEWGWRAGVIRAASHRDNGCHDLQILVEYDDVEWQRREWLSPHRDAVFSFFLVEKGLYWAERPDPRHASLIAIDHHNHANNNHHHHRINGKPLRGATAVANTVAWPALTFYPLVARADLPEDAMPVEFMQDRRLDFVDYSKLKPFTQDWELTKGSVPWASAVRRWAEMQDGQRILLTTPSVLVGFRVEVYRAEGTTQWYTAVIVGYNESTKDLTVTDDTVLEDHNEDPSLVQMRLIGDGVVESIMRGEVVGMTPRRSRSSTALTHALVVPRPGRRPRGRPGNAAQQLQTATPRIQSPISQHLEKEKNSARNSRRRRVSEGGSRERLEKDSEGNLATRQEDRENKGPLSGRPSNRIPRTVLEEANTGSSGASKLRKRGIVAVKSPVESGAGQQRPVRRRPRPTGLEAKPEADDPDSPSNGKSPEKEERLGDRSEEEARGDEEDEDRRERCDPLTKRLRTSPIAGRRLRSERKPGKGSEEAASDPEDRAEGEPRKQHADEGEPAKLEENEESQSRERDREPEPPPPNKVDPGGDTVPEQRQTADAERNSRQVFANGSVLDSSPIGDDHATLLLDTGATLTPNKPAVNSRGKHEDDGERERERDREREAREAEKGQNSSYEITPRI